MAKNQFKFELKITGFELKVEGSKEDVASITSSVANQLKGLTTPQVFGDSTETEDVEATEIPQSQLPPAPQKKKNSRKKSSSAGSSVMKIEPIDFKNDPKKYSAPSMNWTTLQKALWVMYVINSEKKISELSIAQITNTFNTHYKQSKTIRATNVARDLGKVKLNNNALVGENATASPHLWYLTDAGNLFVQNLIKESKG
ncbi:hypothetical protein [Pedobacter sp.]|uniref:hypothetical protein n=1 Tax=Pedobacter sp. TaxID=1411316 RepID=UPI003BAD3441